MQAGRRGLLRRAATRHIGASDPRFPSLFDADREHSRAATHVESCDGVLSDAGSTPAASTTHSRSFVASAARPGFEQRPFGTSLSARLPPPPPLNVFYREG